MAVYYTIEFSHNHIHYTGRLTPEFKKGSENPSSWHVVLNDVFFGYLHKDHGHWEVSEQRPANLVNAVGSIIEKKDYQEHTI